MSSQSLNRRAIVAGSVALLASSTTIAAPLVPSAGHPDEEILTLANEIMELHSKCVEAESIADDAWGKFYERRQLRPKALYPTHRDGMIPGVRFDRDPELKGKTYNCWCRVDDVVALRAFVEAAPPTSKDFVGTDEEWQAFTAEANRILAERSPPDYKFEPPPYDPRLWAEVPDTELHERATQIFNAWEAYQADLDRYKIEIDLDRLSDFRDELDDQLNELFGKLENLKAVTLDGIRTKAMVLYRTRWDEYKPEAETTDQKIIRSVLADLVGERTQAQRAAS
jgi:hypothetical protein